MKPLLAVFSALALFATTASAADLVDGDAQAGQTKAAACAACHGQDGNSANPEWPKLAGQHATYIVEQLHNFKLPQGDSPRYNPIMFGQVQSLSDQDMKDVAAYFAAQQTSSGAADPTLADKGRKIYEGGIKEKNVPACIACHGPTGDGNAAAKFPSVASQHATYIVNQLKAYTSGARKSDPNQMMRNVAAGLSEDDMKAVAQYMQGMQHR